MALSQRVAIYLAAAFSIGVSSTLWAAEPTSSEEAKSQLVSQAETLRKEGKKVYKPREEKPEVEVEKEKPVLPEEEGPTFLVRKIKLEGNRASARVLEAMLEAFQNQKMNLRQLKAVSQMITNYYRFNGYVTSRAYIPPQKVEEGVVQIKVIEGTVGHVYVEGNKYFKGSIYADSMHFGKDKVFRVQDLESSLYFLNSKPDRKAKAYLIAGEEPGTSDIILKAEDKNPFHMSYEFHNGGTKFTLRPRHVMRIEHNNISGRGDTLNVTNSYAEQAAFDGVVLDYNLPMESKRTRFSLETSYIESKLVRQFKPSHISGAYGSMIPALTRTFIREPTFVAEGYVGLEVKDSKTMTEELKTSFDRMRVLRLGPRFTFQSETGKTWLSTDLHLGLPRFMGGSERNDSSASRLHSGGDFMYFTGSFVRINRLPNENSLLLRVNGQWSHETLTSVEQMRLGGLYTVRGYPEADFSGDYGYNLSAEFQMPAPIFHKDVRVPHTNKRWHDALHLVAFVDVGKTFLRHKGLPINPRSKFLLGTGVGVRFDLDRSCSMQVDMGWPIGDVSAENNQKQIYMSFRVGF